MKLPEPTCPYGYTKRDLDKILKPEQIYQFCTTVEHQTCTGKATKADRKSPLQHYATVCADYPHGWIWTKDSIMEFLRDEDGKFSDGSLIKDED